MKFLAVLLALSIAQETAYFYSFCQIVVSRIENQMVVGGYRDSVEIEKKNCRWELIASTSARGRATHALIHFSVGIIFPFIITVRIFIARHIIKVTTHSETKRLAW